MADSGYLLHLWLCIALQEFSDCVHELSLVSADSIWIYVALCSGRHLNLVDNKGVSPCSLVDRYQRFVGGACWLRLQVERRDLSKMLVSVCDTMYMTSYHMRP
jgi:hypothetical protein